MIRVALMVFSLFICAVSAFPQDPVVTVYYYERMPFFGKANTDDEGCILAITRYVLEEANIPFRFEKMPVSRIFELMKKSDANACFPGVFMNPERQSLYVYSDLPIYQDTPPHYVIRKSDEQLYAGVDSIDGLLGLGKTLGLVVSYSHGLWVDDAIRRCNPNRVLVNIGDNQLNFYRMILANRFDFFFASEEESRYIVRNDPEFSDKLAIRELSDAPEGNVRWIIFNKGFPPELIARVNAAIPIVRESERYKALVARMKE